jgi:DNA-binding XRE family transcriptional regulator
MNDYFPLACGETIGSIGRLIKDARQKAHLRQKDLATTLGVSVKTVSNLEAGARTVEVGTVIQALWQLGLLHQILNIDPMLNSTGSEVNQRVRLRTVSKKHPF